jgi:hypothetical protein
MKIVDDAVLQVARERTRCEYCGCRTNGCHPHHVTARGHGGGRRLDVPWIIIGLCFVCHAKVHDGNLTGKGTQADKEALRQIVAERERVTPSWIESATYLLLRLPKGSDWEKALEEMPT